MSQKHLRDFEGRTVLVTGASMGIGKATARAFHEAGAKVVMIARRPGLLREAAAGLDRALAIPADAADLEAMKTALEQTVERFGGLDGLVNNAGVHFRGAFESRTPEEIAAMIDLNLRSPLVLCRLALPYLQQRAGFIVNVASLAGKAPLDGLATYSAAKFGLRVFTIALAQELRGSGVTVSAVSPGPVDTGFIMNELDAVDDIVFAQAICSADKVAEMILACARDGRIERVYPGGAARLATLGYLFPDLRRRLKPFLSRKGRREKERLIRPDAAKMGRRGTTMVIDCHYHLEERLLTVEEMLSRMDAAGIHKTALMGAMTDPIPETAKPLLSLLQLLLARRSTRWLGRRLIERFDAEGNVKILRRSYRLYPHPDNAAVFDLVQRMPGRFLGWVFVRPGSAVDPAAELNRWAQASGFIGVKAHPYWHRFEPARLLPLAEKLIGLNKPLLIHAGFDSYGDFRPLLERAPKLKLVLAHAGFPNYRETLGAVKDLKTVSVDLSQTAYVGDSATRRAVEILGCERCLFGTDGPYGFRAADGKFDYGFIKARLERLFPDPGVRRRLLGENFADLAGIS